MRFVWCEIRRVMFAPLIPVQNRKDVVRDMCSTRHSVMFYRTDMLRRKDVVCDLCSVREGKCAYIVQYVFNFASMI